VPSKLGILALAISLGILGWLGCAPVVDGPIERQRAIDRDDGDRLSAQLARLPGVAAASVVLRRAIRDPLGAAPASRPMLTAVLTIERSGPLDDAAEPEAIRAAATRLARAALPELPPAELAIEIAAVVHRPIVAKLGPFSVEQSSLPALRATLALAFASIAGLGGALALRAWRHRLGRSAQ
jgi:hypothetical protein